MLFNKFSKTRDNNPVQLTKETNVPIVNKSIDPPAAQPYRGKLVKAGGLRQVDDWRHVKIHLKSDGAHLFCHEFDTHSNTVLELHNAHDADGNEKENCEMIAFYLTNTQRMDLAIYLLSQVEYLNR